MTSNKIGYFFAHVFIIAYCGVLLSSLAFQVFNGDMPCPLCVVQRMAMLLACAGPAYIISRVRDGEVSSTDFMTGYGMSLIAAFSGMIMAARQVMLHLTDPVGYGPAVLGLHMYTWALITFMIVILFCAINFLFAPQLRPKDVSFGTASRALLWLLLAIAVVIAVLTFAEEGFNWVLPDNPTVYELFS